MTKKSKNSQTNNGQREAEADFEDFLDLRNVSSKKQSSKKRQSRSTRKNTLRDAIRDPAAMDEYLDEFAK